MLDRTTDACGDVEGGTNSRSRLTDLMSFVDELVVDRCAAGAHGASQCAGQIVNAIESIFAAYAPTTRINNPRGL